MIEENHGLIYYLCAWHQQMIEAKQAELSLYKDLKTFPS